MTITADFITAPSTLSGLGFTLPRSELIAALTTVGLAVGRRPVVPVLGGVLITCSAGTVTLSGYDYEQAVTVTIAGAVISDGCVLFRHRELLALVQAAGKGEKKAAADALPVTVLQTLDTVTVDVDGFQVPRVGPGRGGLPAAARRRPHLRHRRPGGLHPDRRAGGYSVRNGSDAADAHGHPSAHRGRRADVRGHRPVPADGGHYRGSRCPRGERRGAGSPPGRSSPP